MSWAFLIYAIDVLSTDGRYGGWGFFLFFGMCGYIALAVAKISFGIGVHNFYVGKVMTLTKDFKTFKTGDNLVILNVDNSDATMKVTYPNGADSTWLKFSAISQVVAPDPGKGDILKPFRRLVFWVCLVSALGIGYANFMPTKDTAYKMLAAYVGQTVSETPEVRELAGNSIDFLNKAIKKYSTELDAAAAPATEKETKTQEN